MEAAFACRHADYVHLQAPVASGRDGRLGGSIDAASSVQQSLLRPWIPKDRRLTEPSSRRTNAPERGSERLPPRKSPPPKRRSFLWSLPKSLTPAIRNYQTLGCWDGGIEIPRDLYEQALNVFQAAGEITWRHRYEEVAG